MTEMHWTADELTQDPLALIGDLGATNVRIALVRGDLLLAESRYKTADFIGFTSLLEVFLNDLKPAHLKNEIVVSCFGVAGPVVRGEAYLTNVGWSVSEQQLREALNAPALLVNDFYAQATAMPLLQRESLVHICGPDHLSPSPGQSIAVLGSGSGLGEAILVPSAYQPRPYDADDSDHVDTAPDWVAIATEGGHARFAPRNEAEVGLNRWLQGRYGEQISVERVVSGPGVVDIFQYLLGGRALPDGFSKPLTGLQISDAAFKRSEPIALETLSHFVGVYADEAANFTLKSNAGVVFLSGGITPQILPVINEYFQGAFINKGRYRSLLAQVSVWAVVAPNPGLFGAQVLANRLFNSL